MVPSAEVERPVEPDPPLAQQADLPAPPTSRPPGTSWNAIVATFGLPCIIGVAAIDPGNMEVDLQAGIGLGYNLIWALLLSSILGAILQTLAAHVTICTGFHLAELCKRVYRRDWILSQAVFIITLLAIIAFDVAEVIGTAFAIQMLFGVPLWLGMVLSACDTMLVLYLQRTGLSRIELFVEGLLFILAGCIMYEFVLSKPSFVAIAEGALIPSFGDNPSKGIVLAVSIMGSLIMSHNLFLHSWLEKERRSVANNTTALSTAPTTTPSNIFTGRQFIFDWRRACRYAGFESCAIYLSTFVVNSSLLVVAATLPRNVVSEIGDLGLKQAGALFERVFGQEFASTAWAIALLASGHASTVTGALASQAICEGFFDIPDGQYSSLMIMGTRSIAIVPALFAAFLAGEKGSDKLAVGSQTILSFALPFAAIPLFKVLDVVATVRPAYGRWLLNAGYFVFSVVMVANAYAIWELGQSIAAASGMVTLSAFLLLVAVVCMVLLKLVFTPVHLSDFAVVPEQDVSTESERLLSEKEKVTTYDR